MKPFVLSVAFLALVAFGTASAETTVGVGAQENYVLASGVYGARGTFGTTSVRVDEGGCWWGKVWFGGAFEGPQREVDFTIGQTLALSSGFSLEGSLNYYWVDPTGKMVHIFSPIVSLRWETARDNALFFGVEGMLVPAHKEDNGVVTYLGIEHIFAPTPTLNLTFGVRGGYDTSFGNERAYGGADLGLTWRPYGSRRWALTASGKVRSPDGAPTVWEAGAGVSYSFK